MIIVVMLKLLIVLINLWEWVILWTIITNV